MLPDPIIPGLPIHMYGVMIAVGIFCAFAVITFYGRHMKFSESFIDFIYFNGIASIAVGFCSAALFQAVYDFIEDPSAGFRINGSITFLGGLIGGAAFFLLVWVILHRRLKGHITDILAMVPCAITVAHGFGRVGCFFAGCCYGVQTDCFLGVKFPNVIGRVHPTQLYEAAFLFLLFGLLSYLLLRRGFRHGMSVYLVAYGIFRFCLEYLRGDHRGELVGGISPSQFWSLGLILLGIGLFFLVRYLDQRNAAHTEQAVSAVPEDGASAAPTVCNESEDA